MLRCYGFDVETFDGSGLEGVTGALTYLTVTCWQNKCSSIGDE